jgi:hypothetical protein
LRAPAQRHDLQAPDDVATNVAPVARIVETAHPPIGIILHDNFASLRCEIQRP